MVASVPLWQRLVVLVPAFVVGGGIVLAALILLLRAAAHSLRGSRHKRLVYIGFVALLAAVGLLTYLGVKLPRE
ncbi:MAG: hypothetical protein JO186_09340 [Actinobacteria bacterium]|nr:hypothetical protein [Actinomycetota bacterium]